jgi:hypothetical protein
MPSRPFTCNPAVPLEAHAEAYTADAGGVTTFEMCGGMPAKEPRDSHGRDGTFDASPSKVPRGEGTSFSLVRIKPAFLTLLRVYVYRGFYSPAATAAELQIGKTVALPASVSCNEHPREATNIGE